MKYYLQIDNSGNIVGNSNCSLISDEFISKEVTKEEYDQFLAYKKEKISEQLNFEKKQSRLDELTQDFIQVFCGAVIEDIDERKQEFQTLHNELRVFQGKKPREYK